jgi:hypothetical protein
VDLEGCGLCGGDSFRKDNFKDAVIRLLAQVTARNVKRGDEEILAGRVRAVRFALGQWRALEGSGHRPRP